MNVFTSIFLLSVILVLCSCVAQSPESVAKSYWQAHNQSNLERIQEYSVAYNNQEPQSKKLKQKISKLKYEFGEIRILNNSAKIETFFHHPDFKDNPKMSFFTVLSKQEDGQWKVESKQTMKALKRLLRKPKASDIIENLQGLSKEFSQSLGKAIKQFKREVPSLGDDLKSLGEDVQKDMRDSLKEIGPRIKKDLKEFSEALDDIVENQSNTKNKSTSPDKSI